MLIALKLRRALAMLALAVLTAPAARAGFITTRMSTSTPILTFTIPSEGIHGESGYVGPNMVSYDGSPQVAAYCTDLFRSIGVDDHYAAEGAPLSGLTNGSMVARLLSADAALGDPSALEKAALQLAIWNTVETGRAGLGDYTDPFGSPAQRIESGPDHFRLYSDDARSHLLFGLSSSDLVVSNPDGSGVLERMDALLLSASRTSGPGAALTYYAPGGSYGQGFVGLNRSFAAPRAVPEPSSLILSVVGMTGLFGVYLRRRLSAS